MKNKPKSKVSGKIAEVAFFTMVGALYAWALSESVLAATVLGVPSLRLFIMCAGFVVLLNLVFWGKYTAIGAAGLLVIGAIVTFAFLHMRGFEVGWFVALQENVDGLVAFTRDQAPYREEFSNLASLGVAFLFSFVTVLNTRLHLGFLSLALMALGVIAVPIHMGWDRSDMAIVAMLFCLLALLAKRLYLTAQRGQNEQSAPAARYGLMLLPLCLLLFGVGWALPKPDAEAVEALSLPDVTGAMSNIMHTFTPEQTMSFTSDGQRLGGPVTPNDLVVMIVEADERLYLAGAVRDYYTGDAWLSTMPAKERLIPGENGVFDTNPYSGAMRTIHTQLRRSLNRPLREVTITTMDVRTDAIFTPPFHQTLEVTPHVQIEQNIHGNMRGARVLPQEVSYTQLYISWDMRSSYFSGILRGASGRLDTDELAIFLQLPDTLPDRVGDLAREITAGAQTNYDRLRMIESYLADFPYTLEAMTLPEGEDFVDHFLFTAREGYCVHYASAMVVMARTLGIPARFVEGFITPELRAGDNRFWVTNRQAHAWVEAYFPGFGWAMFEPTAVYNLNWDNPNIGAPVFVPLPDEPMVDMSDLPNWRDYIDVPEDEPDVVGQYADEGGASPWVTAIILLVLVGVGVIVGLKLTARYRSKQRGLENMPNREAVVALFASTLNAAGAVGCPISPGETALGYAGRTSREPVFVGLGVDIKQLAGLYSRAAYSNHEITPYERVAALKARDKVVSWLKAAPRNLPRYFVDRYLLLRY
ncbi:MAG: transglutaminase domain-containing protein [Oscillospiraceae bacterium]|nr:transglutaminase domain-containing protein [Oscillospiraceae bacterium]